MKTSADAGRAPLPTRKVLPRAMRAVIVYKGATEGPVADRLAGVADRAVRVEPQASAEHGKLSNLDNNIMNVRSSPVAPTPQLLGLAWSERSLTNGTMRAA